MSKYVIFTPGRSTGGGMAAVAEDHCVNLVKGGFDAVLIETSGIGVIGKLVTLIKALGLVSKFIIFRILGRSLDVKFIFHVASKNSFYRKFFLWCFVKLFGSKTLVHLHGGQFIDFYERSNVFVRFFVRSFFQKSNIIFVLGNKWKNWLADEFFLTNVEVLPNGIHLDNSPVSTVQEEREIDFLFVGRVEDKKGARDLIYALNDPFFHGLKTVFVGNIVDQSIVDACTNQSVLFVGQISRDEVMQYFQKTKIFVLPSYYEAFPVSILEAQKFGAIVISSDVGSVSDIITDNVNGYLISPGDIVSLGNKLKEVYKNYSLLSSVVNAASVSLSRYEMHCLMAKIKRVYETT